jgi:hypothetical protein
MNSNKYKSVITQFIYSHIDSVDWKNGKIKNDFFIKITGLHYSNLKLAKSKLIIFLHASKNLVCIIFSVNMFMFNF